MDQGPLVIEQIDAGGRFLAEFEKYAPVRVAFWLKDSEGRWNLYVASDQVDDNNVDVAYGEVLRIAGQMRDPNFDPFQVKLIGAADPLANQVVAIRDRYPGRSPTRYHGHQLGGVSIEEAYIYPSPVTALGR
jgi:hypothetical protein